LLTLDAELQLVVFQEKSTVQKTAPKEVYLEQREQSKELQWVFVAFGQKTFAG